ncbi:MAG: hypothetical protein L6V88_06285 [Anaerotruncus sp.]|nr:MAG: hypothetical protein L6V88_06285 [Anaerotruncus sp.]
MPLLNVMKNALKKASLYFNADCLVVTNVFRDQLDRYGEVSSTLAAVAAGARNMPNAKLVLNADDPVSFSLSKQCVNFASFGIDKNLNLGGKGESEFCPVCREKVGIFFTHLLPARKLCLQKNAATEESSPMCAQMKFF